MLSLSWAVLLPLPHLLLQLLLLLPLLLRD